MLPNALPSELLDVVAAVDPDAYNQGAQSSGYVDMAKYETILAVALAGDIVSTGKIDLKLQGAVAATGGTDITGKAITQLTQAGSDSNKQAMINLRRSEVDIDSLHRYVKAVLTMTTAGADAAALILGLNGTGFGQNARMSEIVGLMGVVDPDAYAPNDYSTGWVDMGKLHGLLGVLMIGDLGTAGTVSAKFEQATTSAGAGVKDVTGRSSGTFAQTDSPSESNQQVKLDCLPSDLDADNNFRYARLTVTVGDATSPETATSDVAAALFGIMPRSGLATADDASTVDEIVN